jgi:hypothetical protein
VPGTQHVKMTPHPCISLEESHNARAQAWAYVFDCYRKKKAATSPVSRPDDAKGSKHDSRQQHRST